MVQYLSAKYMWYKIVSITLQTIEVLPCIWWYSLCHGVYSQTGLVSGRVTRCLVNGKREWQLLIVYDVDDF